jgi:hypothetical protein
MKTTEGKTCESSFLGDTVSIGDENERPLREKSMIFLSNETQCKSTEG